MTVTPQQLADTLVRRYHRVLEQRRQTAREVRAKLAEVVSVAAREGLFHRLWLVGSLQAGTFGPRSDVDLVCEGLRAGELPSLWRRFEGALDARVDLMRIEELDDAFAQRVRAEGEVIA